MFRPVEASLLLQGTAAQRRPTSAPEAQTAAVDSDQPRVAVVSSVSCCACCQCQRMCVLTAA